MVDCPIELFQSLFCSASHRVCDTQAVGGEDAARIHLLVQDEYSGFLFQVAGYVRMIESGGLEIIFLRQASILQFVGFCKILSGGLIVAEAEVGGAERGVGRTEKWVEVDGPFKKRDRVALLAGTKQGLPHPVRL